MACLIYLSLKARHLEVHRVFGEKAGMTSRNVSPGGAASPFLPFNLLCAGIVLDKLSFASSSLATVETSAEPCTLKVAAHFLHLYLANDF